jgi:hypothetical protein
MTRISDARAVCDLDAECRRADRCRGLLRPERASAANWRRAGDHSQAGGITDDSGDCRFARGNGAAPLRLSR